MQPAHYRGTRGGEKARKRLFYEDSDSVKNSQRHLFPRVPWRRVDWSEATAAVITAFQQIAAAPTDPTLPAWQIVAQFNAALLPHLPAPQVAAVAGAADGAPEEEEQPVEDEYVEVEIDTPEGSIYSPLAPEEEEQELEEEASSSAFPAPTGRGPLSSRTPLVLRPASSVYPTVKIDSTGIWIRYSGPLSQPEPLTGAAPSAPADDQEDPLYFEGDPICQRKPGLTQQPSHVGTRQQGFQNRLKRTTSVLRIRHLRGLPQSSQKKVETAKRPGLEDPRSRRQRQTTQCQSVCQSAPVRNPNL